MKKPTEMRKYFCPKCPCCVCRSLHPCVQVVGGVQVERVTQERDEVAADCHNVERAFRDLSQKYERTREVVARLTETESGLKLSLETLQVRLRLEEEKYDRRKAEAEEELSKAAVRLADTQRTNTREIARLSALLRKAEMNVSSLEVKINQKVEGIFDYLFSLCQSPPFAAQSQENAELTGMCDELLSKLDRGAGTAS